MSYSKKTCNICGWRDIQPRMYRAQKSVKAYTSRDGIGAGTLIGALVDNKASKRRLNKVVFANNKRTHTAHRTVWMCGDCAWDHGESVSRENLSREENIKKWDEIKSGGTGGTTDGQVIAAAVIVFIFFLIGVAALA